MTYDKKDGRKVILVGHLYEESDYISKDNKPEQSKETKDQMGKFLLSIPKELRRQIKFESDAQGFKNTSDYICEILNKRHFTDNDLDSE